MSAMPREIDLEHRGNPPDATRERINRFIEWHRFAPHPFNADGASFTSSYYVRPWRFVRDVFRWCRAFWNRGWYGWDSSDTWELDHTLARRLPQMIRHLNHIKQGTPMLFLTGGNYDDDDGDHAGRDRYEAWLEDLAQAFDDWGQLMDAGPYGHLYTPEWEAAHPFDRDNIFTPVTDDDGNVRLDAKGKPIGYTLSMASPVDDLSDEQRADLRRRYDVKLEAVKARMKTMFDYFETLWD